ncbi:hypothetical protein CJP72_07810 [Citrobacter sp. NCU1]|nr:hypothetical protein [Citrobacter sp. NCU1]
MAFAGLFYAKKKRTTGSAKVHVGFRYVEYERNSLNGQWLQGVKEVPLRFCDVLLVRKLDRDNRSLLCYLSPWTIVAMEDE